MEIIKANEQQDIFNEKCIKLMHQCGSINPNWLPHNKKYNYNLFLERSKIEDISFLIICDGEPVMGLLGFISQKKNIVDIPSLILQNEKAKNKTIENLFLKNYYDLVQRNENYFVYRDCLNYGLISVLFKNIVKNGGQYKSVFSHNLDLQLSELNLKQNLRKSYKSIINSGLKNYNIKIVNQKNVLTEDILMFRELHIREAGRETRSKKSWMNQFEIIKNGEGFLVVSYYNNKLMAAGFFSNSDTECIYQVSVCDNSTNKNIMFHSLMWSAILYAKKIGCSNLEIGDIIVSKSASSAKKDLDISLFKTGFGGSTSVFMDVHSRSE